MENNGNYNPWPMTIFMLGVLALLAWVAWLVLG